MLNDKLKTIIFEALGEASMSWSEIPTGIFDSTNAERIGEETITKIEQALKERDKQRMVIEEQEPILCPKCKGVGIMERIAPLSATNLLYETCDICNGSKIVYKKIIK